jgi:methylated-DNA-protein-cysteine methyltransferase-like protein
LRHWDGVVECAGAPPFGVSIARPHDELPYDGQEVAMEPSFFEQVYALVRQIPRGKVASYGQIAALLGHPQAARTVGWALNALRGREVDDVPWQRVINSQGRISIARTDLGADLQRALLEAEGVEFDGRGDVDLRRFGWKGSS